MVLLAVFYIGRAIAVGLAALVAHKWLVGTCNDPERVNPTMVQDIERLEILFMQKIGDQ